jgi:hypothetical protein
VPIRKTTTETAQMLPAASGKSARAAALHRSMPPTVGMSARSAAQAAARVPAVMPSPKMHSTTGTKCGDTCVTAMSVDEM